MTDAKKLREFYVFYTVEHQKEIISNALNTMLVSI